MNSQFTSIPSPHGSFTNQTYDKRFLVLFFPPLYLPKWSFVLALAVYSVLLDNMNIKWCLTLRVKKSRNSYVFSPCRHWESSATFYSSLKPLFKKERNFHIQKNCSILSLVGFFLTFRMRSKNFDEKVFFLEEKKG